MSEIHIAYLQTKHFGSLNGLRFLAITAVLFHHSPVKGMLAELHLIYGRGFLGVDFFFVISGFLITTLLLRERLRTGAISLQGFYWRRALRILPLYLLIVTSVGAYTVLIKQDPGAAELWPFYYIFLANFLVGDISLLSPTWSLSVEEQYYVLWPLLLILLPHRALLPVLAGLIIVNVLGIMGMFGVTPPAVGPLRFALPTATYAPILMGSALAVLLNGERGFSILHPALAHSWAAIGWGAVLGFLLFVLPSDVTGLPNLALHLTMTALVGSLVVKEDSVANIVLKSPFVVRIGVISYGIYMLHLIGLDIAVRITSVIGLPPASFVTNALYIGFSVLLAEISFRSYESYFLEMRHKLFGTLWQSRRANRKDAL